jgi:U3 small nucleolar RNA-associated protein 23
MRVASGKGNDARKILTFYRINFGLRAPFRVLCDGALIHQALQRQLYLRDFLPVLLNAPANAVVTRCVVEELRALGEEVSAAALFAKRLTRIPCAHSDGIIPARDCIAASVRAGNPKRLLLASNDRDLMHAIRLESGVPSIRLVNKTRLVLMPPARATHDDVAAMQATKTGVHRPDEVRILREEEEERLANQMERRERRAQKRRRPKAPNPLSVKKPKSSLASSAQKSEDQESQEKAMHVSKEKIPFKLGAIEAISKPKRIRKRKPKPQQCAHAEERYNTAQSEAPGEMCVQI